MSDGDVKDERGRLVVITGLPGSVHRWAHQKRAACLIPLLLIADVALAVRAIDSIL